jgi:hypothetical protein
LFKTDIRNVAHKQRTPCHPTTCRGALAAAEEIWPSADSTDLRCANARAARCVACGARSTGDANGLLTAVAAAGYERLTRAMRNSAEHEKDRETALIAIGVAYVRFALTHPALFRLMFHSDRLDRTDDAFRAAGKAAYEVLSGRLSAVRSSEAPSTSSESRLDPTLLRAWAVVHGIATLAIEGRLGPRGKTRDRELLDTVRAALSMQADAYRREGGG